MTPQQIDKVQATWRAVAPIADTAAELFYERLFALDSQLRGIFPEDLGPQKKKLMTMLGRVVGSLKEPDKLVPMVRELGKRHVGYGVRSEDYDTVGEALLWTLERGLGAAWTQEARAAWAAAYRLLADTMVSAAHEVHAD
jgi:hemoglobin-like flavoprotein